jgi:pyruvate kinase
LNAYNPTKIICTLGPASVHEDVLREMIGAGMDMARLNFSHGTHEDHAAVFTMLHKVAEEMGCHVGVIADLQGPKIRTGELEGGGPVQLVPGATLTITTEECVGTAKRVSTTYEHLAEDVKPADRILLDDGLLVLEVKSKTRTEVVCEVIIGGPLNEHKGINLPGVAVSSPSLTEKDREDLEFAVSLGVDYVALSFVRQPEDVLELRGLCRRGQDCTPIIAKLEKPEALARLPEVIAAADAIMIARGDLAVELSPEQVPVWQKRIIAECALQGKPVITATQMLESMRNNPQPTRAEASDVANAIFDGTDAVMLSAETAIGSYPVETVTMMRRIAFAAEQEQSRWKHREWLQPPDDAEIGIANAISLAACTVADEVGAKAIIAFTESGSTARLVSKRRPRVPVLACTPLTATARRCSLYWGVQSILVDPVNDAETMMQLTTEQAKRLGCVECGDRVVLTAGVPMGQPGSTNTMSIDTIG